MSFPYWIEHDQNGKVGKFVKEGAALLKLSPAKLFSGKVVPVGGRCSLGLSCEPSCPFHVKERFFLSPASDEEEK